ncbi:SusC/RagA family TonB-linked outer membrane protein [Algoriphagus formosus]|uniref:TonB-dependent receptor n=1 Tax=Algoriphagus formosus TaxID=2007308 RepID=A0A4R5V8R9_9BACT|nr:TonB-dependent receptor [Algoriphagus aquimaris]TDK47946.1 TonB-dependent receptor [Algoriphagus aquimaris]
MKKPLLRQLIMLSKRILYAFAIQLIFCSVLLANTGKAQMKSISEVMVSISLDNQPLSKAFSQLERKTDFKFTYNPNTIPLDQRVSLDLESATVYQVLENLIRQTNLSFVQINKNIHVKLPSGSEKTISIQELEFIDIRGKVSDASGQPLPGVTVIIEGTTTGTVTDIDGNYSLSASEGDILVFSFVGFESQRISVGNQTTIDIQLIEDARSLEEVIVVGYGQINRRDITGSVGSVNAEKLNEVPTASFDQALQGRVAGVNIIKDSGAPGGGVTVQIRGINSINGNNNPLYVIDGFPIIFSQSANSSGLAQINPGDIESIEILKDASATAIYGTRGANGVILITTKSGKKGRSDFDFQMFTGVSSISKLPVLNTLEFAEITNTLDINEGNSPRYPNPQSLPNIDYQEQIFQSGMQQNYQLSYSSGNEKSNYAIIGNYYNEEGVIRNSSFERFSLRVNANHNVNDRFRIGNYLTISRTNNDLLSTEGRGGQGGGIVQNAILRPPNAPIFDETGDYVFNFEEFVGNNPISLVNEPINQTLGFRFLGNVFLEYDLTKDLKIRVTAGATSNFQKNNQFFSTRTFQGRNVDGVGTVFSSQNFNWLNENILTYNKKFGNDHQINALIGFSSQKDFYESQSSTSSGFPSQDFLFNNLGAGSLNIAVGSNRQQWALASYIFRANYTLKDKYLFTFTGRRDGSSRFGADTRWGFFPSGAFAWRISDEGFLKNSEIISDLKLRTSIGVTGNEPTNLYGSQSLLSPNSPYIFEQNLIVGVSPIALANPDLGWERSRMINIGIDGGLFDNRLTFTLDYYNNLTNDLIFSQPLPDHIGLGSVLVNLGSTRNKGFEFTIGSDVFVNEFKWNTNLNFSLNRNEVLELLNNQQILRGIGPNISAVSEFNLIREGLPITTFFGYQVDGIYQTQEQIAQSGISENVQPGDIIRRDINGDGVVNDQDRMIIGDAQPDFIFGFANNFSYKNFDLNFLINGVVGNEILNMNRYELFSMDGRNNLPREALNYWTGPGTSNTIPRPSARANFRNRATSFGIEDGTFIRLRNISLGYTFPTSMFNEKVKNLRVYVTGQNLITITNYSGFDPEVNSFANGGSGVNFNIQGLDYGSFPRPKTILLGLNLTF